MYDYLRYMIGQDIDVHLKADVHDQPAYPFVIGGVLHEVGETFLVVRHGDGSDYVVPIESIKLVKIESLRPKAE